MTSVVALAGWTPFRVRLTGAAMHGQRSFPPDTSGTFYIGQDRCGHWIVADGSGQRGGIFLHRRDALRFAMDHCRTAAVFMVPQPIDLFAPAAPGFPCAPDTPPGVPLDGIASLRTS